MFKSFDRISVSYSKNFFEMCSPIFYSFTNPTNSLYPNRKPALIKSLHSSQFSHNHELTKTYLPFAAKKSTKPKLTSHTFLEQHPNVSKDSGVDWWVSYLRWWGSWSLETLLLPLLFSFLAPKLTSIAFLNIKKK